MKKVFVVGASGATGKLLVADLLQQGLQVVAIVRPCSSLISAVENHANYCEIPASITELSEQQLLSHLNGCDAVFSCLGHNLTLRGIFGEPRRLVTDTIKKVSRAIESLAPATQLKIILMSSSGNSNRDIPENPPLSQKLVIAVLRVLLPPHVDNEQAADFLRISIGQNHPYIAWAAVRPDNLCDEVAVSAYSIHASPTKNAIFDSAPTSRINVANFMANLATNTDLWAAWKGKMPVIYNDV
ncbi:NAD(P)H-binding protein [Dasania marina]|uniref:NAD(P)H-binding protein n=1 Tax=Dasania marina TaxID=471499 RepID=UPI00036130B9|nr:NAD(P)-binding oxidoreductase [Dasania marina]